MPSSSKTAHGLNLWSAEDHPQRTDFVSDNQKIDDLFSQHIADTALHKTASDKTSLTMGTYKGNNEDMQLVSLPFAPQVLLIYPQNQSPIQKDAAGNLVLYTGAVGGFVYGDGVYLQGSGFAVQNDDTDSVYTKLNEKGKTYRYIAFR
ncbi:MULTISPECIES: hypothetical protein [Caproicibacterium]|jgi:hypothetical protein|uniref:Uncharacterized protein n=1 Tax=Caproicibacterium lactatifermentans TaxID=2666138 RepID=A0A859DMR5_9FIRM|nr:hypothetical protein [Caproicibacterium lactatifermentans]ARP49541.1 hypothetical protein B6259_00690 [Ruminococcaceae bacterium CPB6]MDD4807851.1 hypothetical protein [Oscillospiraceae bacterium]QKN23128.1 hypothetical protein GJQ69_00670 [Caproicibacterium lactatifermentans]QKO30266.1 hypothetical protein GKP14_04100 [Caproicibacterium lactatifermentans]